MCTLRIAPNEFFNTLRAHDFSGGGAMVNGNAVRFKPCKVIDAFGKDRRLVQQAGYSFDLLAEMTAV